MNENPIFVKRKLGEKMDVSFAFIREHLKMMVRLILPVSLPFAILMALLLTAENIYNDTWRSSHLTLHNAVDVDKVSTPIMYVAIIMAVVLIVPMTFTVMKLACPFHQSRDSKNKDLRFKKIWVEYLRSIMEFVAITIPYAVFLIAWNLMFKHQDSFMLFLIQYAVIILAVVAWMMAPPAYIVGDTGYGRSIAKGISYGLHHFMNILPFIMVMLVLCILIFLWELGLISFITDFKVQLVGGDVDKHFLAYCIY